MPPGIQEKQHETGSFWQSCVFNHEMKFSWNGKGMEGPWFMHLEGGGSHHPCTVAGAARGASDAAAHPNAAAFHPHLF